MSATVWKYALKATAQQLVSIPQGAKLLHVAEQHGELCLWAHVDPSQSVEDRGIAIIGTGHNAPDPGQMDHVGSVLMHGGALVFHVFDAGARP